MARIKITELPVDTQISREEMKRVMGGIRVAGQVPSQPIVPLDFNMDFTAIDNSLSDFDVRAATKKSKGLLF